MSPRSKNISLIIASILVGLVLAEITFRAWLYGLQERNINAFEEIRAGESARKLGREATLGEIIRPVRNPRLIYELKPSMVVNFMGADVTTNPQGFRGPAAEPNKTSDTKRIVGLGDSHMFGWGVRYEESYLPRLGAALNESTPGCRWEIINTAVPGYNTVMEVETMKTKGLRFLPDLVIIQYVGNDLSLPNFLPRDYWSLKRLYLLYFLYDRLRGHAYGREFLDYTPRVSDRGDFESDPLLVPPKYRDMVGLASYVKAMGELKELAIRHDFSLLVFTQFRLPSKINEALDELHIEFLEGADAYLKYMAQHGIGRYVGSVLSISASDPHPSEIGHRLQARALAKFLQERLDAVGSVDRKPTCADIDKALKMLRPRH